MFWQIDNLFGIVFGAELDISTISIEVKPNISQFIPHIFSAYSTIFINALKPEVD